VDFLNDNLPTKEAGYHSDISLLEPLICSSLHGPCWGRQKNSTSDCNQRPPVHAKTPACRLRLIILYKQLCDV